MLNRVRDNIMFYGAYIAIIAFCVLIAFCGVKKTDKIKSDRVHDTILHYVINPSNCDSLNQKNIALTARLDSLSDKLFLAKYKFNKARFYVKICSKNNSQYKFLQGWFNALDK